MSTWNKDEVSRSFKRSAEEADRRMMEVSNKIKDRPNYKMLYDEAQAKFYVRNHLQGEDCLSSREALLSHLKWMLNSQPPTPGKAYDASYFERCWQGEIKRLIEAYSEED